MLTSKLTTNIYIIYTYVLVQDCSPEAVSDPRAGLKVNLSRLRRICKGRTNLGKAAKVVVAVLWFPLATEARSTTFKAFNQESTQEILGVVELARASSTRIFTAA